jgi:hypothetical protein
VPKKHIAPTPAIDTIEICLSIDQFSVEALVEVPHLSSVNRRDLKNPAVYFTVFHLFVHQRPL